jgi:hypothetical protein
MSARQQSHQAIRYRAAQSADEISFDDVFYDHYLPLESASIDEHYTLEPGSLTAEGA